MNIFPSVELSDPELVIISQALSKPEVKKYLNKLVYDIGRDIVLGSKGDNETAEDYLLKEAVMKGQLNVLNTLLSIESPQTN